MRDFLKPLGVMPLDPLGGRRRSMPGMGGPMSPFQPTLPGMPPPGGPMGGPLMGGPGQGQSGGGKEGDEALKKRLNGPSGLGELLDDPNTNLLSDFKRGARSYADIYGTHIGPEQDGFRTGMNNQFDMLSTAQQERMDMMWAAYKKQQEDQSKAAELVQQTMAPQPGSPGLPMPPPGGPMMGPGGLGGPMGPGMGPGGPMGGPMMGPGGDLPPPPPPLMGGP